MVRGALGGWVSSGLSIAIVLLTVGSKVGFELLSASMTVEHYKRNCT
jgi:hypothetical protein